MCVCVDGMNLKYALRWHIHIYQFIPYYASAIHKHTHAHILKPFVDSEPTGLQVDIAISKLVFYARGDIGRVYNSMIL